MGGGRLKFFAYSTEREEEGESEAGWRKESLLKKGRPQKKKKFAKKKKIGTFGCRASELDSEQEYSRPWIYVPRR